LLAREGESEKKEGSIMGLASKSILLFLGGAAVGAAAALLTAPMSGKDTRRKLKDLSGDWANRASRVAPAIRKATSAGKDAFVQAWNGSGIKPESTAPPLSH
jgi:gas vesicle protein